MGLVLVGWKRVKRRVFTLLLVKIGVNGAIKKPRQAWGLAVAITNLKVTQSFFSGGITSQWPL